MDTVVSIQARMESTRLPGKVLLPIGGTRVLDLVGQRSRDASRVGDPVFALGDNPPNTAVEEWCERTGNRYLVGPEDNLLERHRRVADEIGADVLVRVTGDCPFLPPGETDRVVAEHAGSDARYTTNHVDGMPIGTALDVLDATLLAELAEAGERHPVRRLREHPESYATTFTGNPDWTALSEAHVAVDTPADYWTLTDAVDAVGKDPKAVAEWVAARD